MGHPLYLRGGDGSLISLHLQTEEWRGGRMILAVGCPRGADGHFLACGVVGVHGRQSVENERKMRQKR